MNSIPSLQQQHPSFYLCVRILNQKSERLSNNNNIINEFCPEKVNRHRHREESAAIAGRGDGVYFLSVEIEQQQQQQSQCQSYISILLQRLRKVVLLHTAVMWHMDIYIHSNWSGAELLFVYLSPLPCYIILLISIDRERKRLAFLTKLT